MSIRKSEKEVYEALDKRQSFCFDAGPGSGKTYTLTKAIEYIITKNKKLQSNNQQILCITYTNAAKEEIESRIGKNTEVVVSTIHDFLWNFISPQTYLLKKEHEKKIFSHIQELKEKITKNDVREEIKDIESFKNIVCSELFKKLYYENYNEKAKPFRDAILNSEPNMQSYLSNASKFKDLVNKIIEKNKLEKTLHDISKGKGLDILYDSVHNRDLLDQYKISHDTLLKFAKNIITENDILKRLFIDKYPYVLIDEYQDTDPKVIDIFMSILEYSSGEHSVVIGYFGDSKQNIYEHGVGRLEDKNLISIKELENRRSCQEIVNVINKIRNDGLVQVSNGRSKGSCIFYKDDENTEKNRRKLKFSDGSTAFLFMKNDRIAKMKNFDHLYYQLQEFPHFAYRRNSNILNEEFLQNNLENIGWFLRNILNLIDFKIKIENDLYTTVSDIAKYIGIKRTTTFRDIELFLLEIRKIDTSHINLKNYLSSISKIEGQINGRNLISNLFSLENEDYDMGEIYQHAYDYFYNNHETIDDEEVDKINNFFDLDISEFVNWYRYVFKLEDESKSVYTMHGSKGLEFDNVVVILQDDFAGRHNYFKYFFENYENPDEVISDDKKFMQAQNLLYVACSRAKTNLRVIYENSNLINIEDNIQKIFGKIEQL